ncbi:MAG: hypothetical protein WBV73_13865 [Phormidium sp.]
MKISKADGWGYRSKTGHSGEGREQGTGNREQGTENKYFFYFVPAWVVSPNSYVH